MKIERTYAGIPSEFADYEKSKIVLLPVPYDQTSTWGKGADKGPEAFLAASENMEIYDIESDSEVFKHGIYLANPLSSDDKPEIMVKKIKDAANKYYADNKFFTMIGGEHSVSIGAIMASKLHYENLSVLQLDAHSDLRATYNDCEYNHACALHWASKNTNLIQVGIRSMAEEEKQFVNKNKVFYASNIVNSTDNWQQKIIDKLGDYVYLTIDLDFFDPSILPATGTPEPGGLNWYPSLDLLYKLAKQRKIIGFDICELAPIDGNKTSEFLAAKLYYKLLTYIFER